MSEPKTKMTLLLTAAERARLDALRLARGDRSAAATIRALVRDAGGDTPRAPAAPPGQRSGKSGPALHRVEVPPGGASIGGVYVTEPGAYMVRPGLIQPAMFDGPVSYQPAAPDAAPAPEPDDPSLPEPVDLDVPAARADFLARVGCSPEEYLRRWRAGQEDDGADALLEAVHHAAARSIEAELGHCLPDTPPTGAADVAAIVIRAMPLWAGLDPGGDPPDPLRPAHVRGAG